jgi:hypothetical protein
VAGVGETPREDVGEPVVVLDDQHAHSVAIVA